MNESTQNIYTSDLKKSQVIPYIISLANNFLRKPSLYTSLSI